MRPEVCVGLSWLICFWVIPGEVKKRIILERGDVIFNLEL
jgi:hypothetical protein